jgi:hypothetical protein
MPIGRGLRPAERILLAAHTQLVGGIEPWRPHQLGVPQRAAQL